MAEEWVAPAPTVIESLARVMRDVTLVAKTDRNEFHNFDFRGIDAVLNHVGPALRNHHVVVVPAAVTTHREQVEVGEKRTLMANVEVQVTYRFYGPAGDWLDVVVPGEAGDTGDKATPKAMSVAFRTALIQALSLPTGDPDPDEETYERAPARTSHPQSRSPGPQRSEPEESVYDQLERYLSVEDWTDAEVAYVISTYTGGSKAEPRDMPEDAAAKLVSHLAYPEYARKVRDAVAAFREQTEAPEDDYRDPADCDHPIPDAIRDAWEAGEARCPMCGILASELQETTDA